MRVLCAITLVCYGSGSCESTDPAGWIVWLGCPEVSVGETMCVAEIVAEVH